MRKTAITILVLIILAGVAVGYIFTDGFTKNFQVFYVEHKGERILLETQMTFSKDVPLRFDCKDTQMLLNCGGKKTNGYIVSVTPNDNLTNDFVYTVDGLQKSFLNAGDLTKCFKISMYAEYFTITINSTMQEILNYVHQGQEVILPEMDFSTEYYFLLTISNKAKTASVYIEFKSSV